MAAQRVARDLRVKNNPELSKGFVRYSSSSSGDSPGAPAQFADVSVSGMRLISRFQSNVSVGSRLKLEFELPGNEEKTVIYADVVRKAGDYEFAVRFLHRGQSTREELKIALQRCRNFFERSWIARQLPSVATWAKAHRQGLMIAVVGGAIVGTIASMVYFSSDEYLGKPLRAWGLTYPKEMFLDYYRKMK